MLNNHTQEIRKCYQQAARCVQLAEAQNNPKVQKQFLELTRCWLLLADPQKENDGGNSQQCTVQSRLCETPNE
jgi:hypothetical protein